MYKFWLNNVFSIFDYMICVLYVCVCVRAKASISSMTTTAFHESFHLTLGSFLFNIFISHARMHARTCLLARRERRRESDVGLYRLDTAYHSCVCKVFTVQYHRDVYLFYIWLDVKSIFPSSSSYSVHDVCHSFCVRLNQYTTL